jgi:hypothetical protein
MPRPEGRGEQMRAAGGSSNPVESWHGHQPSQPVCRRHLRSSGVGAHVPDMGVARGDSAAGQGTVLRDCGAATKLLRKCWQINQYSRILRDCRSGKTMLPASVVTVEIRTPVPSPLARRPEIANNARRCLGCAFYIDRLPVFQGSAVGAGRKTLCIVSSKHLNCRLNLFHKPLDT